MKFSTKDRDNDQWKNNCAAFYEDTGYKGGWRHNSCSAICPNHGYKNKYTVYLNRQWIPLVFIEIKIRPKNCIMII